MSYKIHCYVMQCSGYQPPEYIDRGEISEKFDIFSLGVVMIQIISGYKARFEYTEIPHDEFIDLVRNDISLWLQFLNLILCHIYHFNIVSPTLSVHFFQEKRNWRSRLEKTWSGSSLEAYCNQVEACTRIALSCTENDSHRRPSIKDIIDMLKESEIKIAKVINIIICFWQKGSFVKVCRGSDLLVGKTSFHYICDHVYNVFRRQIVVQLY